MKVLASWYYNVFKSLISVRNWIEHLLMGNWNQLRPFGGDYLKNTCHWRHRQDKHNSALFRWKFYEGNILTKLLLIKFWILRYKWKIDFFVLKLKFVDRWNGVSDTWPFLRSHSVDTWHWSSFIRSSTWSEIRVFRVCHTPTLPPSLPHSHKKATNKLLRLCIANKKTLAIRKKVQNMKGVTKIVDWPTHLSFQSFQKLIAFNDSIRLMHYAWDLINPQVRYFAWDT